MIREPRPYRSNFIVRKSRSNAYAEARIDRPALIPHGFVAATVAVGAVIAAAGITGIDACPSL